MDKNIKVLRTISGEFVITVISDVTDDGMLVLEYPSVVVPVPQQQGQIGFGKYMPFSDYKEDILMNPNSIAVETTADPQMIEAYESWLTQIKAQESGIVMANRLPDSPPVNRRTDFSKLNM